MTKSIFSYVCNMIICSIYFFFLFIRKLYLYQCRKEILPFRKVIFGINAMETEPRKTLVFVLYKLMATEPYFLLTQRQRCFTYTFFHYSYRLRQYNLVMFYFQFRYLLSYLTTTVTFNDGHLNDWFILSTRYLCLYINSSALHCF